MGVSMAWWRNKNQLVCATNWASESKQATIIYGAAMAVLKTPMVDSNYEFDLAITLSEAQEMVEWTTLVMEPRFSTRA